MQGLRWATGNVNWRWIFTWTAKLMNRKEKNRILFACTAANRKLMFWLIDSGSMARAALRNLCQNWQFALPFPKVFHLSCYKFLSFRLCLMWIFFLLLCFCLFSFSLLLLCSYSKRCSPRASQHSDSSGMFLRNHLIALAASSQSYLSVPHN